MSSLLDYTLNEDKSSFLGALYEKALLIRQVEQEFLSLFASGKLFGTVHTCIGQEFCGVTIAEHLNEQDTIFSNHRCHGHYLARTGDVQGLIAELMGRKSGVCGGRGGSQHLCKNGFFSNGIQGGIVPIATGLALSHKTEGNCAISVVYIGDGTLGEGIVYESMNIASRWKLPLLIVLENNGYSQSTSQPETLAGSIAARAQAFGIRTFHGTTWDVSTLYEVAGDAVRTVRESGEPAFISIDTYRLMAHSKGDDNREEKEVSLFREKDPLNLFVKNSPAAAGPMLERNEKRIKEIVREVEKDGFAECTERISPSRLAPLCWNPLAECPKERVGQRLYEAFFNIFNQNDKAILIGEDIEGSYGGAFKVTKDLSTKFPGRVRNTPISEAAIVGIANGLALSGMRPIVEIMFGDFMTLAMDQILNHASKFRYMYNEQVSCPIIIRTPMGGKRGYGPTHSQSLEKHFMGIPDVRVVALNSLIDPERIYAPLFDDSNKIPTIVIENKLLYTHFISTEPPEGFVFEESSEQFPTVRLSSGNTPDLTILCYGGMLPEAQRAMVRLFDEHEKIVEVICPSQIYPLSLSPIVESALRSGRLLVVEEGVGFAGFGAEVLAELSERGLAHKLVMRRLSAPPQPIPSYAGLEKEVLPGEESIIKAALEVIP